MTHNLIRTILHLNMVLKLTLFQIVAPDQDGAPVMSWCRAIRPMLGECRGGGSHGYGFEVSK